MEQKLYRYGCFPFGLGLFGVGPTFEEEEECMMIKYNTTQDFYTSVTKYGDVRLLDSSVDPFDIGDAQISIDGGSFANLINNIRMQPLGSGQIFVPLSSPETVGKLLTIRIKDQTDPPLWNDKTINIETYGNSNAYIVDNLNNIVSASNFVATDISSLATSAQSELIFGGVESLITDITFDPNHALSALDYKIQQTNLAVSLIPINNNGIVVSASNFVATDISSLATSAQSQIVISGVNTLIDDVIFNPNHALSALDYKAQQTAIAVGLIPTDNNGIVVSASNVGSITSGVDYIIGELGNTSYGLSATKAVVDMTVADVLGYNIDGMPMNIALEKIIAWATGKTEYANSVFTYFKQDNVTQSFALSATDTDRTRV